MSDRSVLVVMCGLSFSGKSTLASRLAHEMAAQLLSLDAINEERGLDGGQGIPLDQWAETNRIAHERVAGLIRAGRDVIVDDTGSPRFIRDQWREVAVGEGATFALVWVQITPELQRERVHANRSARERRDVVDAVLDDHSAHFDSPYDEDPIVVHPSDTNDDGSISKVSGAIRARGIR